MDTGQVGIASPVAQTLDYPNRYLDVAAVVSAPIQKLCEAYWDWSSAALLNNACRALFREACVKGANRPAMKTGLLVVVLLEKGKYNRKAHNESVDVLAGYVYEIGGFLGRGLSSIDSGW